MAGVSFPSWVYNNGGQAALIVSSQAAFNALPPPGTWSLTPFPPTPPSNVPSDPGFPTTDTRLQQILIESRITNQLLASEYVTFNSHEDPVTTMRPDTLANDSSVGS